MAAALVSGLAFYAVIVLKSLMFLSLLVLTDSAAAKDRNHRSSRGQIFSQVRHVQLPQSKSLMSDSVS